MYKESIKLHDNLNQMSYEAHKRSGTNYYETSKRLNQKFETYSEKYSDLIINIIKSKDKIALMKLSKYSLSELLDKFKTHSEEIYTNFKNILEFNENITKYEEDHLNFVESYYLLLNSSYFSKELSDKDFNKLKKVLQEKFKGNNLMINILLNVHGKLTKEKAIVCINVNIFNF
jgi:hypothetical protein